MPGCLVRKTIRTIALLGVMAIAIGRLVPWWAGRMAVDWYSGPADVLVILGGGEVEGELPSFSSYTRAVHAFWIWKANPAARVLVTGSAPLQGSVRKLLASYGIPAESIEELKPSHSTRTDVMSIAAATGSGQRITVVTSDLHSSRARACFRKAGLEVRLAPAPDCGKPKQPALYAFPCLAEMASEYAKTIYYRSQGWL